MYIKQTWTYGNLIEIRKFHKRGSRRGEHRVRGKGITSEKQNERNERQAIRQLTRILIANFRPGEDQHVVLTYRQGERPDPEGARRELQNFIDRIRRAYRKEGQELKMVWTTEYEKVNIHHHIVINDIKGSSLAKLIREKWPKGGIHMTPLYPDREYEGLAEYFVKETKETFRKAGNPFRTRYSRTRNLIVPTPKEETVQAGSWREIPAVPKKLEREGYYLVKESVRTYEDGDGFMCQEYMFRRPEDWKPREKKKRRRRRKCAVRGGRCRNHTGSADRQPVR